ncbi:hypothetical protein [Lacinutrix mariniflava]|uniref:hypothetical protein n=1 Tax=Lacinutrix mariniflava TaxID=342955 RepID=UPI0006E2E85B|nr:hypothetical protein [Lacinutrix mariniflava]
MKIKLNIKRHFSNILAAIVIFAASSELVAQEKKQNNLKSFKVVIEKTDSGIRMQSLKGSAWIDLEFNFEDDEVQAIDEYGMTTFDKIASEKDANLADFLFTITQTEKGIVLKGIEGTAWTDLSFYLNKLNEKQVIDQFGMSEVN